MDLKAEKGILFAYYIHLNVSVEFSVCCAQCLSLLNSLNVSTTVLLRLGKPILLVKLKIYRKSEVFAMVASFLRIQIILSG